MPSSPDSFGQPSPGSSNSFPGPTALPGTMVPQSRHRLVARRWTWATIGIAAVWIVVAVVFCMSMISAGTSFSATTGQAYGALLGMIGLLLMTPLYVMIGFALWYVNKRSQRSVTLAMTSVALLTVPFLRPDVMALATVAVVLVPPGICAIMATRADGRASRSALS